MQHLFTSFDLQQHADLADLLELLSIGLTNPTRDFAGALNDGSYFADLSACLNGISTALDPKAYESVLDAIASCAQAFSIEDDESLYHAVNQEFTRLFVAPRREQMPLYESLIVHRGDKKTSMFINPTCMHCEQEYRKHGFPFPEKGKTPGDHVAIELRYLAFLIAARISVLTESKDTGTVDQLILDFTSAHIKRWLHSFADELKRTALHPFYQIISNVCLLIEPLLLDAAA